MGKIFQEETSQKFKEKFAEHEEMIEKNAKEARAMQDALLSTTTNPDVAFQFLNSNKNLAKQLLDRRLLTLSDVLTVFQANVVATQAAVEMEEKLGIAPKVEKETVSN